MVLPLKPHTSEPTMGSWNIPANSIICWIDVLYWSQVEMLSPNQCLRRMSEMFTHRAACTLTQRADQLLRMSIE